MDTKCSTDKNTSISSLGGSNILKKKYTLSTGQYCGVGDVAGRVGIYVKSVQKRGWEIMRGV